MGWTVIREYPEEGANISRECRTWKDCCSNLSESISDNGKIGPRSRPHQPKAFGPSGPGCFFFGLGTKKSFCFFPFCSASIPSVKHCDPTLQCDGVCIAERSECVASLLTTMQGQRFMCPPPPPPPSNHTTPSSFRSRQETT